MIKQIVNKFTEQKVEGVWAAALKVHITAVSMVIPLIFAWAIWITNEQFVDRAFRLSGERFTQSDGRHLEDKLVTALTPKVDRVDQRLQQIERDSTRIFTKLESIEEAIRK